METTPQPSDGFDPQADLDLLDRAKASVGINNTLDFGPWWYAPLLATCVAGCSLFGRAGALTSALWGVLGLTAAVAMAAHDYRRRTVKPKFSLQSAGLLFGIVIISWAVVAAWGTAVSSTGYERFVPGFAILGWLLTTAVFLLIRQASYAVLARRTVLT